MSEVKINYKNLENAQAIFDCVKKHFDDFDYQGADGDWDINRNTTASVVKEMELPFDIVSITVHNDFDETYDAVMYHQNGPVYNEVVVMTHYDGLIFDYAGPLDVMAMLDEIMGEYKKMKERLDFVERLTYDEQNNFNLTKH